MITFLLLLLYGLFIAFSCTEFFLYFLLHLIVILSHGYVLSIISISIDLLAISFQKHCMKERLFRKASLPNGVKAHQALVHGRYLDSFVLDGRDEKPGSRKPMIKIDVKNERIYCVFDEANSIDSENPFSTCSRMLNLSLEFAFGST